VVELVPRSHQVTNNPDQITPDGAADAAIVHLKDFFIGINNSLVSTPTSPNSFTMTATF
jgi:hypothetical protein